jgi:hypothetical protein
MTMVLIFLVGLGCVPAIFGSLMLFHVFIRKKSAPVDKSNRINHLRLVWFAMTRETLFVELFPWLKNDEYDNVKD